MRIKLCELRRIIRDIVKEAHDSPTISSDLDPHDKELMSKYPRWGNPQAPKMGSNIDVKVRKVQAALKQRGLTTNAENKKKVTQDLPKFIRNMDPSDVFLATTDELADQFIEQYGLRSEN